MDLFDQAWEPVAEHYKYNAHSWQGRWKNYDDGTDRRICNVRFDVDIALEMPPEEYDFGYLSPETLDILWREIKEDMEHMFEYSDKDKFQTDPLLQFFEGSRKQGKRLDLVAFPRVSIFQEYKPRKNLVEFTIYFIIYGEWK